LQASYNFSEFIKYLPTHQKNRIANVSFLEWFIGFSEGDGSFSYQNGYPKFIINQAHLQVLNLIQTNLGFGIVRTFSQNNRGRYTVGTKANVRRLIALFNGNLQFEKTQQRFKLWVETYNKVFETTIRIKGKRKPADINLKSSWIAGLFDSEGGFHAHIKTSKIMYRGQKNIPPKKPIRFSKRLYLKAYIDQQFEIDSLKQIATLFKLAKITVRNEEKQHYRIELSSKEQLIVVFHYFETHKLKSRKLDAYAIWSKLANLYVNTLHLDKIDELEKSIARLKEVNYLFKELKDVLLLLKAKQENSI